MVRYDSSGPWTISPLASSSISLPSSEYLRDWLEKVKLVECLPRVLCTPEEWNAYIDAIDHESEAKPVEIIVD